MASVNGQPPVGFWKTAAAWRPAFAAWAAGTPRRPRGIWFSELFAFLTFCRLFRVGTVIESGLHAGQSSEAIRRWHSGLHYGIDRDVPTNGRGTMRTFCGDAEYFVPLLLDDGAVRRGGPVAILLDGPKDVAAVELARLSLAQGAALVAIHDMYELEEGRSARGQLIAIRRPCWFTDDERFVDLYRPLDGPPSDDNPDADPRTEWFDEQGSGKLPYRLYRVTRSGSRQVRPMCSYGPTLAFVWQEPER